MESLGDVIIKRYSNSLISFMKLVDPEKKFTIDADLGKEWDRLPLIAQRKLYLYLLYRKWRGIDIFGEPYYIIRNCHPVPFNWNGQNGINELIKTNRVASAKYNGAFGIYTYDEIKLYQMTNVQPLNPID